MPGFTPGRTGRPRRPVGPEGQDEAAFPRGWVLVMAAFRYYYWGIIISCNYGPNHKGTKAQRTHKEIRVSLRLDDPCKAVSWPRPALAPGRCLSGLRRSSGRTGLPGGDGRAGGQAGQDHGFTRRRYRREVPMREDNYGPQRRSARPGPPARALVSGGRGPGPTQMANAGSFQEDGKTRIGNVALISPRKSAGRDLQPNQSLKNNLCYYCEMVYESNER
jgi:hypothetical protein